MDFGIMFFSSSGGQRGANKYRLLKEATKFADENGFCCVWTPERHFHDFGGLFPNPAVTSAALAMITSRVQIRAGSLISPLHDALRIAEEWSVIDNLSNGRAAISFGAGWNIDDFIFFPDRYFDRQTVMYEQIECIRALWSGRSIGRMNSAGKHVEVSAFPKPIQAELPVWVTSSGNPDTFVSAGAIGANILTHLIGQTWENLSEKILLYRDSLERNHFDPRQAKVSLMLHSFVGSDLESVKSIVRDPFREYLRSAISLEEKAALGGGAISGGHKIDHHNIPDGVMDDLLDITFERYFQTAALMGIPSSCRKFVSQLEDIGVDEIACLIDFGVADDEVLSNLIYLNELRESFSSEAGSGAVQSFISGFTEELE